MVWRAMQLAHDRSLVLDLDGVVSKSIFRFLSGFGGEIKTQDDRSETGSLARNRDVGAKVVARRRSRDLYLMGWRRAELNPHAGADYVARFAAPGFTSLLPMTGLMVQ